MNEELERMPVWLDDHPQPIDLIVDDLGAASGLGQGLRGLCSTLRGASLPAAGLA